MSGRGPAVGRWILVGALVIAIGLTVVILRPVWRFARGISDPTSLPAQISACDRQWKRDSLMRSLTAAQASVGGPFTVVTPGPFGMLTACPWPGTGFVATVIFVRIGEDAYVGYELRGGP